MLKNLRVINRGDYSMDDDFSALDEGGGSSNEWMNTYADLVTLLLCFFVMLFSMSTLDNQKFKKAIAAFNSIGILGQTGTVNPAIGDSLSDLDIYNAIQLEEILGSLDRKNFGETQEERTQREMNYIYDEVKNLVEEGELSGDIILEKIDEGVVLRFKDEFLFTTGQADLRSNVKTILQQIGDILRRYDKKVKIEGHTDNMPINTIKFPSNWELSTARAISVIKYYTEELTYDKRLNPDRLEASGYGEYHPIVPNDSETNRQKNRRVEIIIFK
jgi:chemotaxis protein MotB